MHDYPYFLRKSFPHGKEPVNAAVPGAHMYQTGHLALKRTTLPAAVTGAEIARVLPVIAALVDMALDAAENTVTAEEPVGHALAAARGWVAGTRLGMCLSVRVIRWVRVLFPFTHHDFTHDEGESGRDGEDDGVLDI